MTTQTTQANETVNKKQSRDCSWIRTQTPHFSDRQEVKRNRADEHVVPAIDMFAKCKSEKTEPKQC